MMMKEDVVDQGRYAFGCSGVDFDDRFEYDDNRAQKSRERNREHAKRTRLRKKAVLEVMKDRLLSLQNEASRLQQAFDESNTANILLCLSVRANPVEVEEVHGIDGLTRPDIFDSSTLKGNIIDHLRTSVRAEAAQQNQQLYKSFGESAASSSSIQQSSCEDLSDIEDVDSEHSTGCHEGQSINWKNGTIMLPEGGERKLSVEEMEILRKERNRMHAKLTRDRKKMFTSRIQQMINSLERSNALMRCRLKGLAQVAKSLAPHESSHGSDSCESASRSSSSPSPSDDGSK